MKKYHFIVAIIISIVSVGMSRAEQKDPKWVQEADPAPWVGESFGGLRCTGTPRKDFGPYDYRYISKYKLGLVENNHFTPKLERLEPDSSLRWGLNVPGNLNFTIRAIPNHHRALFSMLRFSLKGGEYTRKLKSKPECYFQRAINYAPDDAQVKAIFGIYLHRIGKYELAKNMYQATLELQPDNPEAHYNFGLLYFDAQEYKMALSHAKKAYEQGYPLKGLADKLLSKGFKLE